MQTLYLDIIHVVVFGSLMYSFQAVGMRYRAVLLPRTCSPGSSIDWIRQRKLERSFPAVDNGLSFTHLDLVTMWPCS